MIRWQEAREDNPAERSVDVITKTSTAFYSIDHSFKCYYSLLDCFT